MSKKALRAVMGVVSFVFLIAAGSFAFAQSEGGLKEYSGEASFKYGGGFFLKTGSGEEYKLVLGPPWYLENLGLTLRNGDKVAVKGYDDGYGVLYVVSLTKGAKTYDIADDEQFADVRSYKGNQYYRDCPGMRGYGSFRGRERGMRGYRGR